MVPWNGTYRWIATQQYVEDCDLLLGSPHEVDIQTSAIEDWIVGAPYTRSSPFMPEAGTELRYFRVRESDVRGMHGSWVVVADIGPAPDDGERSICGMFLAPDPDPSPHG